MAELTDYEIDVLRHLMDLPTKNDIRWGAALSVTIEHLSGSGYVIRQMSGNGAIDYVVSAKGLRYLRESAHARNRL